MISQKIGLQKVHGLVAVAGGGVRANRLCGQRAGTEVRGLPEH